jgi:hypothetical protein
LRDDGDTDGDGRGWRLPETVTARLRLALGYPYRAPSGAYVFHDGAVHDFDPALLEGRTPVLAHGSNRAPSQLARKFAHFPASASTIPVSYVWLHDYDVVYSAHVTSYGAVASTLQHAPGCRARVALTWLDPQQLARMHETEGNYSFGVLDGVAVAPEAGEGDLSRRMTMYLSNHGHLVDDAHPSDARPIGLSAVRAEPRPHSARTQGQILETLRRRLAPERGFEGFVLGIVHDDDVRHALNAALAEHAGPTRVPHFAATRAGGVTAPS